MFLFDPPDMTADAWYERGCDIESASRKSAFRAYQNALALEPNHAAAHANLGRLLHEAGVIRSAEEHYRAALRVQPEEPTHWYNLGVALEDQQRTDDAANAYRTAITLDPDCREAHYNLARLLERIGDRTGALRHLAAYRRLDQASAAPA
jgi:tetratricopeptide (TPR) repeat protein